MKINHDFKVLGVETESRSGYIEMLSVNYDYLVPAKYVDNTKVAIKIEYEVNSLYSYDDLETMPTVFKLKAIKSVIKLVRNLNSLLQVNIEDIENLYFTSDAKCLELTRILDNSRQDEVEYCNQIKGLIGNLLTEESVFAIASSAGELLAKDKLLGKMANIESLDKLDDEFSNLIKEVSEYEENNIVFVKKNYVENSKRIARIRVVIIIILLVITVFLILIYIPNRNSQLKAVSSYEASAYEDVLVNLEDTNINTMSPDIKYIEAQSTVKLSQLSDTQKDNILQNLSPSVDEGFLDFWVYIGQGNLETAYDQSIKNNDAQQKAYVLLLLIDRTQNDSSLKQADKDNMLSTYQGELDSITASMNEQNKGDE